MAESLLNSSMLRPTKPLANSLGVAFIAVSTEKRCSCGSRRSAELSLSDSLRYLSRPMMFSVIEFQGSSERTLGPPDDRCVRRDPRRQLRDETWNNVIFTLHLSRESCNISMALILCVQNSTEYSLCNAAPPDCLHEAPCHHSSSCVQTCLHRVDCVCLDCNMRLRLLGD